MKNVRYNFTSLLIVVGMIYLSQPVTALAEDLPSPAPGNVITESIDEFHDWLPRWLHGKVRDFDARFATDDAPVLDQPPMDHLTLGIYTRTLIGKKTKVEIKPDMQIDVELPNLQRRVTLFVESASGDDLPGRDKLDREDKGWTLGASSKKEQWNIRTDAGVRAKWLPEVFVRAAWKPLWDWGAWHWNFEQRVFWESDDGFGLITQIGTHRWLHDGRWFYQQNTSGKFTETSDGAEWEQSFRLGRALVLFDERRREQQQRIGTSDAISGYGLRASVFGSDDATTEYQLLAVYRFDLYKRFVIGEIRAGPQWRKSEEWDTETRLDLGIEMRF